MNSKQRRAKKRRLLRSTDRLVEYLAMVADRLEQHEDRHEVIADIRDIQKQWLETGIK